MAAELKPCPFCGGDAEMDIGQNYRNITTSNLEQQCAIYCTSCGAQHSLCYRDFPGICHERVIDDVKLNWNARPLSKDQEAARE